MEIIMCEADVLIQFYNLVFSSGDFSLSLAFLVCFVVPEVSWASLFVFISLYKTSSSLSRVQSSV